MINVASFSEPGGHPINEDAFVVERHPSDHDSWFCLLADGQGGRSGGKEAAQLACRVAADAAAHEPLKSLTQPAVWNAILRRADQAVNDDPEAGFTTLLGFVITGARLIGASSGDSAVMSLSAGEPARDVTKSQFKNPPVGSGVARFVPFSISLIAPWAVLAMSDGVWKYAGWDRMVQAAAACRGEALVETVQSYARLPGSGRFPDDFTLVVFNEAASR